MSQIIRLKITFEEAIIINMRALKQNMNQDDVMQVILSKMFLLFLTQTPRVNPHYEDIRQEFEAWLLSYV